MVFYKLLRADMNHRGFKYKEGYNELPEKFDINPKICGPGGLYFSDEKDIFGWTINYFTTYNESILIAKVTLLNDSQFVAMIMNTFDNIYDNNYNSYKTDKLILSEIQTLENYFLYNSHMRLLAVKQHGFNLRFIKEQTVEICLEAIKTYYFSKTYMISPYREEYEIYLKKIEDATYELTNAKTQTYDICINAVRLCGMLLRFVDVKFQTPETYIKICVEAMKQDGNAIIYCVNIISNEIMLEAVRQNGLCLKYINLQDSEMYVKICIEAVKNNYKALKYVKNQTINNYNKIYMEAIIHNGMAIQFIKFPSSKMYIEAIKQNHNVKYFITYMTPKIRELLETIK